MTIIKLLGDFMKRKRLDRDLWWDYKFELPRYYQMRIDTEDFHGLVCLVQFIEGNYLYWDFTKAGKAAVIGKGMTWLQLIPDGRKHIITAKYSPDNTLSICYVDVIEDIEYDPDGVAVFIDKYLDVIFTPQGDVVIADRNELDEALQSADISKKQYDAALSECNIIIEELCTDIEATTNRFDRILLHVNNRIKMGFHEHQ